ncbi:MAG: hypothetical protein FJ137_09920 [Deltaproteobacteria bacterium]|nr:hypothetical protein [Deltaproteobacteria bacterium]
MSVPSLFVVVYLVLGMGTSTAMWTGKQDELELAMTLDLDDEAHRPLFRLLLALFFLLAWPLVVFEAFGKDR